MLPQLAHTPDEHLVPGAVHRLPVEVLVPVVQQGLPGPPHAPALQLPLLHVPGMGRHEPPLVTQIPDTQQPPSLHELPEQHNWVGEPHADPTTVVPPVPAPAAPPLPAPPTPTPPAPTMTVVPPLAVLVVPPPETAVSGLVPKTPPLLPKMPPPPDAFPPLPPSPMPPVPGRVPLSVPLSEPLQPTEVALASTTSIEPERRAELSRCLFVMGTLQRSGR